MTAYYLCGRNIAKEFCPGKHYIPVHYHYSGHYAYTIQYMWRQGEQFINAVILKDINDDIRLLLTLKDPLFKEVTIKDMSSVVIHYLYMIEKMKNTL